MLHLTLVTQRKQSTDAKVRILQQEKQSTPSTQEQGHTQLQTLCGQPIKDKESVFWLFALHNHIKNKGRENTKEQKPKQ